MSPDTFASYLASSLVLGTLAPSLTALDRCSDLAFVFVGAAILLLSWATYCYFIGSPYESHMLFAIVIMLLIIFAYVSTVL